MGYKGEDLHARMFFLCHPEDSGGVGGFMIPPERLGGCSGREGY